MRSYCQDQASAPAHTVLAVALIASLSADRIAFYATAATVLPIIMIAFAFQLRAHAIFLGTWLPTSPERSLLGVRTKAGFFLAVVVLSALFTVLTGTSEITAVMSLASDKTIALGYVRAAMFVSGFLLMVGIGDAVAQQLTRWAPEWLETKASAIVEAEEAKPQEPDSGTSSSS